MNWFLSLYIRVKLFFAFGSLILLSILIMLIGMFVINRAMKVQQVKSDVQSMQSLTLRMDGIIRDFNYEGFKQELFLTGEYNEAAMQFSLTMDSLSFLLQEVRKASFAPPRTLDSMVTEVQEMSKRFDHLVSLYQKRGFRDYGLEGSLREAIHHVEKSDVDFDKSSMLMLRRHEKDFFLRKDFKYVDRFNEQSELFRASIELADADSLSKQIILTQLNAYRQRFNQITALEKEIGVTVDQGAVGNVIASSARIQQQAAFLKTRMDQLTARAVNRGFLILVGLLILQISIGIVLTAFYSSTLTKSITEIKNALQSLASGAFPEKLKSRTRDEIGDAKQALNVLIERIQTAVNFSGSLGKGKLRTEYHEDFREDVLAKSLIRMQEQLLEADEKRTIEEWINSGMAKMSSLLQDESTSLQALGDQILKLVINHIDVNQGVIYITAEDQETLELLSTYAYGKKRYQQDRIPVGHGLIGQTYLERSPVYLQEIPAEYIRITSGLGEKAPTALAIIPLVVKGRCQGIMEVAGFSEFRTEQREFLNRCAESIAAVIQQRAMADKTRELLEISEERAQSLSAQEEELRQNSEELMATQEEMERQKRELLLHIEVLEKRIAEFEGRKQEKPAS